MEIKYMTKHRFIINDKKALKETILHPESHLKPSIGNDLDHFQLDITYDKEQWIIDYFDGVIDNKYVNPGVFLFSFHSVIDVPWDDLMSMNYDIRVLYHRDIHQISLLQIDVYHLHFPKLNQDAWNEAYAKAPSSYKNIVKRLLENPRQFLTKRLISHLDHRDFAGHHVAQLACNNGREIMAILMQYHADQATGFDISDSMIKDANQTAKLLQLNAKFIQSNLYEIDETYHNTFDDIFIMIGAITWFDDLSRLFKIVFNLLKPQGHFYLLDGHPITGMFAFEGEEGYDEENPYKLVHSYFRKEPFVDTDGMYYMNQQHYKSSPFVSFSHTFTEIIQGLIDANLSILVFEEGNENMLENFPGLDGKGVPLIFYIDAIKR